jgi:hypothetical protein
MAILFACTNPVVSTSVYGVDVYQSCNAGEYGTNSNDQPKIYQDINDKSLLLNCFKKATSTKDAFLFYATFFINDFVMISYNPHKKFAPSCMSKTTKDILSFSLSK